MAKATDFQKQVKRALTDSTVIFPDNLVCKADGSVVVKRSYFYRHGWTAERFAEQVAAAIATDLGLNADQFSVEGTDQWAAWPKTSYFVATVRSK